MNVVCEPGTLHHVTRQTKLFFSCLTYESLDHTHGQKVLELLVSSSPSRERCSRSTGCYNIGMSVNANKERRSVYLLRTGNSNALKEHRYEISVPGDRYRLC